jgi:hypothetical protein
MIVIISVSFGGWYDIVSDLPGDAIWLLMILLHFIVLSA